MSSRSWRAVAAAAALLGPLCGTGAAQETTPLTMSRPSIALVLAGGGAKGAAHIGVLRVLDELHVPVDCVVGTSMGALVGATYATGMSPEEIERQVLAIDWERTVGGQGRRDRMPIKRKLATMTYTLPLEVGMSRSGVRMPGGLIVTQEIEQFIRTLVAPFRYTEDFDDLPIPFRAIATDMVAGEIVVLDQGDLSEAMRASMALPGVFAPIEREGKVLSDGGMMRNLPVDFGRELCGDVVIAVWMSSPPADANGLTSALSLVGRSIEVMIGANERLQMESLTPRDVGIDVPMGDIGTSDFTRIPEAVELGRRAAEGMRDQLLRYSVSEPDYVAWRQSLGRAQGPESQLAEVRIVGTDRVNPQYLRAQLENAAPGAILTSEAIAEDTERIYALGDFEGVDYSLTGPPGFRVLEIEPTEKGWGPNFFRFDLGMAAYEGGDMFAILRLDHDRTWMNSRGGSWHNALQLGRQSLLLSDFYQPFDVRQRFFVQPIVSAQEDLEDLYLDRERVARYELRERYGQVDFGVNFGTTTQLRLGMRNGWHQGTIDTGVPALPQLERTEDTSYQFRLFFDTRNSVALPTHGAFLTSRYVDSDDALGGEFDYSLIEAFYAQAFGVRGGNSLNIMVAGADTLSGELPPTELFTLGGIRTFPGLRPGEFRGSSYWSLGARYSWRLVELSPLSGQALYAGVRAQVAEMRKRFDGVEPDILYGLSGSVGGSTPVGPFLFSLGYVDGGEWRVQFTLGRPVAEGSMFDEVQ
ncbi:MAG TPA: patatin-like phospholipase family protein [Gammaproteobacteria bacterium]|nr:patatin-like phospholipase family protein [Gammaproteobacteria bacterium]